MWPTKKETGVQLTYGISGPGILFPTTGNRTDTYVPEFRFPRLRDHAARYRRMKKSALVLSPPKPQVRGHRLTLSRDASFLPQYIVLSLAAEADALDEEKYDPEVGALSAVFQLGTGAYALLVRIEGRRRFLKSKSNIVAVHAVAWADGETLNVLVMMPVKKRLKAEQTGGDERPYGKKRSNTSRNDSGNDQNENIAENGKDKSGKDNERDGNSSESNSESGSESEDNSSSLDERMRQKEADNGGREVSERPAKKSASKWLAAYPRKVLLCDIEARILQVAVAARSRLIAVRTTSRIVFLEVRWNNDPKSKGLEVSRIEAAISPSDVDGHSLVHVEFAQDDRFLVVDLLGTVAVFHFEFGARWTFGRDHLVRVPEPQELSAWRRACFSRAGELLVASRTGVSLIQLQLETSPKVPYINVPTLLEKQRVSDSTPKVSTIILARMWSRIQDMQTVAGTPYIFLLTTQEIIWCTKDDMPLRRLVSWKHYLDNSDLLMRMSISHEGNQYICAVFSARLPLIVVFSFAEVEGRPCSVRDPYFLRALFRGLSHLSVAPAPFSCGRDPLLTLVESGKGVIFSILRPHGGFCTPPPPLEMKRQDASVSVQFSESQSESYKYSIQLQSPMSFKPTTGSEILYEQMEDLNNLDGWSIDVHDAYMYGPHHFAALASRTPLSKEARVLAGPDALRQYARLLSAAAKEDIAPTWHALATLGGDIPQFEHNRSHFDAMTLQLRSHYASSGLAVENQISSLLSERQRAAARISFPVDSAASLARALDKLSRNRLNIRQATMLLATSLIRAARNDLAQQLDNSIEAAHAEAPKELQEIFNDWEEAPPPLEQTKKSKRELRRLALANSQPQFSQGVHSFSSHVSLPQSVQSEPRSSQSIPSQTAPSQSLTSIPVVSSSQISITRSQSQTRSPAPSQGLKRFGLQTASQKKKKKKGGFA